MKVISTKTKIGILPNLKNKN